MLIWDTFTVESARKRRQCGDVQPTCGQPYFMWDVNAEHVYSSICGLLAPWNSSNISLWARMTFWNGNGIPVDANIADRSVLRAHSRISDLGYLLIKERSKTKSNRHLQHFEDITGSQITHAYVRCVHVEWRLAISAADKIISFWSCFFFLFLVLNGVDSHNISHWQIADTAPCHSTDDWAQWWSIWNGLVDTAACIWTNTYINDWS